MTNTKKCVFLREKKEEKGLLELVDFKRLVKDRVIMVLVYYRLSITYTLMEFLSDSDGSE